MKKTQAMINKEKWLADGKEIPKCVNPGCNNHVIVRDWKYYSFKHICASCAKLMKEGKPPREGVAHYKKNYCENRDGRLGFMCPVDKDYSFPSSVLHGDHIDGNHENNVIENLQTLCSICHHTKGMNDGDFISAKKGRSLS
ncbi:MAG: HNH endonuclease [Candidatus Muirbacterium halophilum]|nr:HNH endonuclease [Candidatus Muirbacterium halophilum]